MRIDLTSQSVYPAQEDIIDIHRDIVSDDPDAEPGVRDEGAIEFVIEHIEYRCTESIHEQATHLMRMLAANHSFVDGNKRTALNATWTFYFFNGYYFDYGEEIKAILKLYAVMEAMVDTAEVEQYFSEIAKPIEEADEMDDEVQELFGLSREVTHLIGEIEKDVEEVDGLECIQEVKQKITAAIDLIKQIQPIVANRESEEPGPFGELIEDEVTKLENNVEELEDLVKDFK